MRILEKQVSDYVEIWGNGDVEGVTFSLLYYSEGSISSIPKTNFVFEDFSISDINVDQIAFPTSKRIRFKLASDSTISVFMVSLARRGKVFSSSMVKFVPISTSILNQELFNTFIQNVPQNIKNTFKASDVNLNPILRVLFARWTLVNGIYRCIDRDTGETIAEWTVDGSDLRVDNLSISTTN